MTVYVQTARITVGDLLLHVRADGTVEAFKRGVRRGVFASVRDAVAALWGE